MLQEFKARSDPRQGPARLEALREQIRKERLSGFLVPRADAHSGEFTAPSDERLAWLTGFTGSAGWCAALLDRAAVFVDGRYRAQVRQQVDLSAFTPVDLIQTPIAEWLAQNLPDGAAVGFDPWLASVGDMDTMARKAAAAGFDLMPTENLIDRIWADRPLPPKGRVRVHPLEFAGKPHAEKREEIAGKISAAGAGAAVITLPESVAWLLNVRGSDIPRMPAPHSFAILRSDGSATLLIDPDKVGEDAERHFGEGVRAKPPGEFAAELAKIEGKALLDRKTCPVWVRSRLHESGVEALVGEDPCLLAKACKTEAEIEGTRRAHARDGAAMVEFLAWIDREAPRERLTEIDVVTELERLRGKVDLFQDIAFETIAGSGPNGAIVHYRVTESTSRKISSGDLLLVDSGGQYLDGTTDITRTIAIGPASPERVECFTRVLRGMIALSMCKWPKGLAGRGLDSIARHPLWIAGMNYDHGTGHGVGCYLGVHEGPQSISPSSSVPLRKGMIVSNEPGYYREGEFGIRIENLVVVAEGESVDKNRETLQFETLTWVPIDRNLIDPDMLSSEERQWLNAYHAEVLEKMRGRVSGEALSWLEGACRAI